MTGKRSLNILIATGVFWPAVGGPAQQTELYRRAFERAGHTVKVVTYAMPGSHQNSRSVEYLDAFRATNQYSKVIRQIRLFRAIWQIFSEVRPDVVHSQTASGPLPLLIGLVARIRGVPSWVKIANDPEFDQDGRAGLASGDILAAKRQGRTFKRIVNSVLTRAMLSLFRFVWVTTPTLAQRMSERWDVSRSRIHIESNRFNLEPLANVAATRDDRSIHRAASLLIVSRLEPIKGIDVALRALALLDEGVTLRVIGDGLPHNRAYLENLSLELGLASRVYWMGAVEPEKVSDYFIEADMLLVPSRFEAFGNVIVEAMAAGAPVVASDIGGIPYVTNGKACASLVPPENPEKLAEAIEYLLRNDEARQAKVEAGKRRATNFSIEAGVDRWIEVFTANLKA